MARTVMLLDTSLAVAEVSVMAEVRPEIAGQIGSCPGASPNQTTMCLAPARQPIEPLGGWAIWSKAKSWASGPSPPPAAVQVLKAGGTAAALPVSARIGWKTLPGDPGKSAKS